MRLTSSEPRFHNSLSTMAPLIPALFTYNFEVISILKPSKLGNRARFPGLIYGIYFPFSKQVIYVHLLKKKVVKERKRTI